MVQLSTYIVYFCTYSSYTKFWTLFIVRTKFSFLTGVTIIFVRFWTLSVVRTKFSFLTAVTILFVGFSTLSIVRTKFAFLSAVTIIFTYEINGSVARTTCLRYDWVISEEKNESRNRNLVVSASSLRKTYKSFLLKTDILYRSNLRTGIIKILGLYLWKKNRETKENTKQQSTGGSKHDVTVDCFHFVSLANTHDHL